MSTKSLNRKYALINFGVLGLLFLAAVVSIYIAFTAL